MNFRSRRGSANLDFKHWCLVCRASASHIRAQSGSTWCGASSQELLVWPCASSSSDQVRLAASQESWSMGPCSGPQNPDSLQCAVRRSFRNMSSRIARSSPEKSLSISHQELHSRRLCLALPRPRNCTPKPLSPNKSLQRSGGRWYLVCKQLAGIDKVPMISLGEPPGAELSRWATDQPS
jgi:hypothetical protein